MKKICFFITLTTLLNYYYVVPVFLQKAEQLFFLYNGMMQKEKLEYINANTEHSQIKRHDLCLFCVP